MSGPGDRAGEAGPGTPGGDGFDYDLFVIGGGSGGVRAARIAAGEHGARVGLAEEFRMGGTCVIRGCVPKKLMVYASGYPELMDEARAYGWDVTAGAFDWPRFQARLRDELARLEGLYRKGLDGAGVTIHDARATLDDAHTVRLSDGGTVTARHVLVATGGRPFVPGDVPGCELALTSNDIFDLPKLPETMLIVGGGYIASEFACILAGLGVKVTQCYRGAQILRGFDDEARDHVAQGLRDRGVDLRLDCDVTAMARDGDGIAVTMTGDRVETFGQVLYATGRTPNTEGLGLEALGVTLGRRNEVCVDEWSQSSVPSIFAVGDVTDRIALTPVAIREGHAFADTVFGGRKVRADHHLVPGAVFTQPEYGYVGLTEAQAAERHSIEVYATAFRPMRTLFAGRQEKAFFKLVVDAGDRRVLGCHVVAPDAGEMIQLAAIAVRMGATKEDFDRTVAVHPTMAEELVTMRHPVRRS